ncbi:MAG: hypothetical protein AVDCRST_MAG37-2027, partial [uncultured Rubrobacteraceae bacterium]
WTVPYARFVQSLGLSLEPSKARSCWLRTPTDRTAHTCPLYSSGPASVKASATDDVAEYF